MATTKVSRGGVWTWVGSAHPGRNNYGSATMRLRHNEQVGLLWYAALVPAGRTVTEATLVVEQVSGSTGTIHVAATRNRTKPGMRSVTWDDKPATIGGTWTSDGSSGGRGAIFQIDVTEHLQAVADGEPNHGWRITTDSDETVVVKALRLMVTYTTAPRKPTDLTPSTGAVSVAGPVVTCDYTDTSGSTDLAAMAVQVNTTEDGLDETTGWTSPLWTSGPVPTTTPTVDLGAEGFALADGDDLYWACRVKDGDGKWSLWSDPAPLRRRSKGTLEILNPSGGVVTDHTPVIAWLLTGRTQEHYRVRVARASSPQNILWDSGKTAGTSTSVAVPGGVITGPEDYIVTVDVWDTIERESTPGDQARLRRTATFTFAETDTAPPVDVLLEPCPDRPGLILTWTRTSRPDSWTIERNGRVVEVELDSPEVRRDGTTYTWTDHSPKRGGHTYAVRAVVNERASSATEAVGYYAGPQGVWLGDPDENVWLCLSSATLDGYTMTDTATVFTPTGSRSVVRVVTAMRGRSGTIQGILADRPNGALRKDAIAALRAIKENPGGRYRLIGGDLNDLVIVGDVDWGPDATYTHENPRTRVTFTAYQAGGWDFDGLGR